MAQYKNTQKISFTKAEESRLRKLFNQWGASIESYNRNTLGDELKVIEVYDSPIYRVLLRSQYDNRTLKLAQKRINGKVCPPKTIDDELQINRWKILPFAKEFTSAEKSYFVPGSEYITSCHNCWGEGRVHCSNCGGDGKIERKVVTTVSCSNCNGRGYNEETKYKRESEYYYDYVLKRQAIRYFDKPYTNRVYCPYCHGSGRREDISYKEESCKNCNETGRVLCTT